MQRSTKRPDRIETEKVAGEKTKLRIWHSDPEYQARIEVEREEKWQFGIDEESVATLLSSTTERDDLAGEPEIPDWLSQSLAEMGIQGVESA
ncbi:hypothetical protein [Halorhabdus amylolytica]|uniref:hypothetical protein n=1 Tax=Halorhabdus amylolytica TaxID=2559573 RepID=UPI0010A9C37F|nr:hypothetical protein [Halorhabdus amylolytica]